MTGMPVEVCLYQEVVGDPIDVVEDGNTFEENARKKVMAMPAVPGVIFLADDSGLCVDALNGRPGVLSARYGGEHASFAEKCEKLLGELAPHTNRNAHFACVIAIRFPDGTVETVEGAVKGQIALEPQGTQGFGYDPIFVPEGHTETFAQLPAAVKNQLSHRANALQKAKQKITIS